MVNVQIQKVLKVGSSLGVVIPANILRAMGIQRGDKIAFATYDQGVITIKKLTEEELLKLKPPIVRYE